MSNQGSRMLTAELEAGSWGPQLVWQEQKKEEVQGSYFPLTPLEFSQTDAGRPSRDL